MRKNAKVFFALVTLMLICCAYNPQSMILNYIKSNNSHTLSLFGFDATSVIILSFLLGAFDNLKLVLQALPGNGVFNQLPLSETMAAASRGQLTESTLVLEVIFIVLFAAYGVIIARSGANITLPDAVPVPHDLVENANFFKVTHAGELTLSDSFLHYISAVVTR
jgi:hypothetical protein